METSIFLAQLFAIIYLAAGLGLLLNRKFFKKAIDGMYKNPEMVMMGGIMALVVGFFIVKVHNIWVMDWMVLITLVGWIALIKGVLLFLAPTVLLKISKPFVKMFWLSGVFSVVLGVILGYFGYLA